MPAFVLSRHDRAPASSMNTRQHDGIVTRRLASALSSTRSIARWMHAAGEVEQGARHGSDGDPMNSMRVMIREVEALEHVDNVRSPPLNAPRRDVVRQSIEEARDAV